MFAFSQKENIGNIDLAYLKAVKEIYASTSKRGILACLWQFDARLTHILFYPFRPRFLGALPVSMADNLREPAG